jgi:hypothetical protein
LEGINLYAHAIRVPQLSRIGSVAPKGAYMAGKREFGVNAPLVTGLILIGISTASRSQSPPFPLFSQPVRPTSAQECQAFSAQVDRYAKEVDAAHSECLDKGTGSRNEPPGSRGCARASCQPLHDLLIGEGPLNPLSVPSERGRVSDCYKQVEEYLAAQARDKHEDDKRRAQERQDDDERRATEKRDDDERHAAQERRDQGRRARQTRAQQSQEATRQQDAAQATANSNAIAAPRPSLSVSPPPISPGSLVVHETPEQYQARMAERAREEKQRTAEVLKDMINPFGTSQSAPSSATHDSAKSELVDPFSASAGKSADTLDAIKTTALDVENKFVETEIKSAKSAIEKEIAAAKAVLPPNKFQAYEKEGAHELSFIDKFGTLLHVWNYGTHFGLIAVAKSPQERHEAVGDLMTDAFKDGVIYVAKKVNTRFAAVLEGPLGWAAGYMLDAKETDNGPMEIVFDKSIYDVNEKRAAFDALDIKQKRAAFDGLVSDYKSDKEHYSWAYYQWLEQAANQLYNSPSESNNQIKVRP